MPAQATALRTPAPIAQPQMSAAEKIPSSMLAAVVLKPAQLEIQQVPVPSPGPGQVLVKLEGCGVCASNIPPWEGRPWFNYPMPPGHLGHEGWGTIAAIGSDVHHLYVGQRIAMLSDSAYAQYDVTSAEKVIPLPENLEGKPFPGEPLGCAFNIFARSQIRDGQTVAIVGIGFLGAILTQLAKSAGARVFALSRRAYSLEIAAGMGADETIVMDDHYRVINQVKELTGGRFCDVTIEAAGKQWPVDLAGELTCERGRLVIAGYHQDGPRQVNMQLWNWRGLDVINAHEREACVYMEGMGRAIDAVSKGKLDPTILYTHHYRLWKLEEALNATRDRKDKFVKALVMMQ